MIVDKLYIFFFDLNKTFTEATYDNWYDLFITTSSQGMNKLCRFYQEEAPNIPVVKKKLLCTIMDEISLLDITDINEILLRILIKLKINHSFFEVSEKLRLVDGELLLLKATWNKLHLDKENNEHDLSTLCSDLLLIDINTKLRIIRTFFFSSFTDLIYILDLSNIQLLPSTEDCPGTFIKQSSMYLVIPDYYTDFGYKILKTSPFTIEKEKAHGFAAIKLQIPNVYLLKASSITSAKEHVANHHFSSMKLLDAYTYFQKEMIELCNQYYSSQIKSLFMYPPDINSILPSFGPKSIHTKATIVEQLFSITLSSLEMISTQRIKKELIVIPIK